jgi:hypothetical protein
VCGAHAGRAAPVLARCVVSSSNPALVIVVELVSRVSAGVWNVRPHGARKRGFVEKLASEQSAIARPRVIDWRKKRL